MAQDGGKQQTNAYGVFVQACWDLHKCQYPDEVIHKEIEGFNESFLKSIGWYEDLSEQQCKRPAKLHHVASHRGYESGGDDFVLDAVGDVADRDLGPGVVLGEGGGEDVVEEVWCHAVLLLKESGRKQTSEDQIVQACWDLHKLQYPDKLIHKEIEKFNEQYSVWWYDISEQECKCFQEIADRYNMRTGASPELPDEMSQVGENLRVATEEKLPETLKELGRCHQVQPNLATFEAAAMQGFVKTNRIADQDLGPGVVLGGGGGEDVVKEVGWRAWRRRKRWRKGRQKARGNFCQLLLSFHNFSRDPVFAVLLAHVFGGGGGF
jgi:hypothetical protein